MKSKNEIIEELYRTKFVDNYVFKKLVNKKDIPLEEATSVIWEIICSMSEEKLQELYSKGEINGVRKYVSGIICRQCCSTTSSLYHQEITKNPQKIKEKMMNDGRVSFSESEGLKIC